MWCRSFKADANGYAKGDDLCLLLLKRLDGAERDGDRIYCVLRDVLSGHDGNEDKINFIVPSAVGQRRLLENIYSRNNFDTRKILFVEAHRTGTPVDDSIEANCLIKSNLGHTAGAAGVASLIKVAMCMYHRDITANIQFTSLNPKIEAQKYDLHILQKFVPFPYLPNNEKISIGVNSFGMGGTTRHVIIKEYQPNKTLIENGHIDENHIQTIFVLLNRQQLQEQINAFLIEQASPGLSIISRPTKSLLQKICFVFSGQGPQLYESEALFNKWINLIDGEMTKINNVALTALFVSWNIYPSSIISHSVGDQAAAFVADHLSLEETVHMLAVSMSEEDAQNKLLKGIEYLACIAVVNSPRSVTISGDEKTIDEIQQILSISYPNVFKARLCIENAFHSYQMDRFDIEKEMLSSLSDIRGLPLKDPQQIELNDNIPVDGQYWWSNVRQTVRFYDAITSIIKDKTANVFLEISPHPVLATSIRECYELTNQQPLILPTLKRKENEQITLLTSLAQLTTSSPYVWQQYFHTRQILPMKNNEKYFNNFPLYKFHLSLCWYESKDSTIQRLANRIPTHPLLGIRQLNEQTSATWKSLININLSQHAFLKDYKIQVARRSLGPRSTQS
ncbi:unnamed protein product [Adineta steineri]|uniref:Ketosynthase family 3 (KS3) domain-containing protein n=1 Tax=Adineta steineri TaxID=433720 RepID=A0A813WP68_9BILA|nr:unnamed protein product [Adineta steineri]CAF1450719.1 unnamed protein product [Adineta steineri]CAF3986440.1 unnamed protein product [Adineta steineri]CAF4183034.1 unnamed protein product [Adineta steineri]CAF4193655.1 unnamed protein product [Adineta steineri]